MNQPLSSKEANELMIKAVEYCIGEFQERELLNLPVPKFTEQIQNVSMLGLFELYKAARTSRKRLLMPHELDCDHFTLIICPFIGCTIVLESEPVKRVESKLHKYNLN
jgi:hypothetical protein